MLILFPGNKIGILILCMLFVVMGILITTEKVSESQKLNYWMKEKLNAEANLKQLNEMNIQGVCIHEEIL